MTNAEGGINDEATPHRDFIIRHLKIPSSFACHAEAFAKGSFGFRHLNHHALAAITQIGLRFARADG